MNIKIPIPKEIEYILDTLSNNGFEAYIVGGAVRNFLLNLPISDYDITTNATPNQIHSLFKKCIDTGIKHGTVTVISGDKTAEITTYRADGEYKNHRKPETVSFSKNLIDDVSRRDFTLNSICYGKNDGIVDFFDGICDIKSHIIRAVGNADKRFFEDALRMLRLIRFSCVLNFKPEEKTKSALYNNSHLVKYVSFERIREEFKKIILSDYPEMIFEYKESGIFDIILQIPFFDKITKDVTEKLKLLDKNIYLRCAYITGVLFDFDIVKIKRTLKRLKLSNCAISNISEILYVLNNDIAPNEKHVKIILTKISAENLIAASYLIKNGGEIKKITEKIIENKIPYLIKHLDINGNHLIKMGYDGKDIGNILNYLQSLVIDDCSLNTKEKLEREVAKRYENERIRKN